MRTHGTLIKWNDERGFGFIDPATGGAEIFVHASAFPRDGVRPRIGELVSFDVNIRNDGKSQAVRVMRPGTTHRPQHSPARSQHSPGNSQRSPARSHGKRRHSTSASIGGALLLAAMFAYAYFSQRHAAPQTSYPTDPTATLISPSTAPDQLFQCDGHTRCPQMTSCAEATYFLDHCPGTKMDGNHDGVPCERQWCGGGREE